GTGKDLEEYGEIPYHLIDIAEPGSQYNVHQYCRDFEAACSDIRSRKAFPILCGGTGLYISAVTGGYDFENRKPLSAPIESREESSSLEDSLEGRAAGSCEEGCLAEKSF
ncbi:MAG TPA: tRNA dimethylallyltransferase, partial [Candidatus Cryptobacteroides sp.]|nr:tRNA dimethylallyltransferase [Candidatus Cryptobacteroides sp.]